MGASSFLNAETELIDGVTLLARSPALEEGRILPVRITRTSTYDLEGSVAVDDA